LTKFELFEVPLAGSPKFQFLTEMPAPLLPDKSLNETLASWQLPEELKAALGFALRTISFEMKLLQLSLVFTVSETLKFPALA
jgi:hypothetical protein